MNPDSLALYEILQNRVEALQALCTAGVPEDATESIHRASLVLLVAALDAFTHEKSVEVCLNRISDPTTVTAIARYLNVTPDRLSQSDAQSVIRYHLSFKTLVMPESIDKVITASGENSSDIWQRIAISRGVRESRIRTALTLQVDRRNQIAHEGDWDSAALELRRVAATHVEDCQDSIGTVVRGLATHWPS